VRDTACQEIEDGIYRISRYFPGLACAAGLTVNQFLVLADEPMLVHTGFGSCWPEVAAAIERLVPLARLRWITFGHVEADECGALDQVLAAAPHATVALGARACEVAFRDGSTRPPRAVDDGEPLDLGGRRVRFVATPHAPHNWEAQVWYEEATGTLLCGDLFTQAGPCRASARDIVADAIETEEVLRYAAPGPAVPWTLRMLALFEPRTLAAMHGGCHTGDGAGSLRDFATAWEARFAPSQAMSHVSCP
jgi:flavorubredoxin